MINDPLLKKLCYLRSSGLNDENFNINLPDSFNKTVNFGEYKNDKSPLWSINLYDYDGHDCRIDISLENKGLIHPNILKRIGFMLADYMFNQLNLERCTLHIRASNHKSIRIGEFFGFKLEGIKRNGFDNPTEDLVILGLLKSECSWIGENKNVN
jgi:RimJ/RimL family protein N-acetyltransferase